ncbi:transport protein SEC31A-like, partial [Trifolium pratense]
PIRFIAFPHFVLESRFVLGKSYVDLLQDLMEKTIVLALATGQKRFGASLCKLVEKYAKINLSKSRVADHNNRVSKTFGLTFDITCDIEGPNCTVYVTW